MNYNYFPDDLISLSLIDYLKFDNHSLVQFYHRNLAYFITLYILILSFIILKNKEKNIYKPLIILISALSLQIILGVFTLLSDLNLYLASAHQITSILLIFSSINLYYCNIK